MAAFDMGGGRIAVSVSPEEIRDVVDALGGVEKKAIGIIRSAINETTRHGVTSLVGQLKDVLNTRRVGDIRDHVKVAQLASDGNLVGVIRIDYKAIALFDFKGTFRKRSGVTVTTIRGAGAENFKHMFRATMQSGHVGFFGREMFTPKSAPKSGSYTLAARLRRQAAAGRAHPHKLKPVVYRQSIREAFGPSVLVAFEKTPDLAETAIEDLGEYFQKRLASKMAWQLEKLGSPV